MYPASEISYCLKFHTESFNRGCYKFSKKPLCLMSLRYKKPLVMAGKTVSSEFSSNWSPSYQTVWQIARNLPHGTLPPDDGRRTDRLKMTRQSRRYVQDENISSSPHHVPSTCRSPCTLQDTGRKHTTKVFIMHITWWMHDNSVLSTIIFRAC